MAQPPQNTIDAAVLRELLGARREVHARVDLRRPPRAPARPQLAARRDGAAALDETRAPPLGSTRSPPLGSARSVWTPRTHAFGPSASAPPRALRLGQPLGRRAAAAAGRPRVARSRSRARSCSLGAAPASSRRVGGIIWRAARRGRR
jgi:hypothetical protein